MRYFVPLLLFATGALWSADSGASTDISVEVNCSYLLDRPAGVKRISIANAEIAEAVATSTTEIVVNGKAPGDTSLIVWDQDGNRNLLTVHVLPAFSKIDLVRDQIARESGPLVNLTAQDGLFFLTGTTRDLSAAERAMQIAGSLGKVVNLLRVATPEAEPQILLKVRFADVDRSVSTQFAVNLFQGDSTKGIGGSGTGQFGSNPSISGIGNPPVNYTFNNLLNIFYFRPDINMAAIIQDLAAKNLLEMLAEPNLLTISGKPASFLAGGEFPFPTLQGGGSGIGQVTIQFRDFGIKLNFIPTITPRGTIRLRVTPEVSSLDYSNGLSVSGFTIPGLTTRRVDTEVELRDGQSFVIAGLLNNQVTEQLSRMPGLANIPLLGKLFQSRSISKSNSELLILVTPEVVRPIPPGQRLPEIKMPSPFLEGPSKVAPQAAPDPEAQKTMEIWRRDSIPVEDLLEKQQAAQGLNGSAEMPANASAPAGTPLPASGPTDPSQPKN